MLAKTAWHVLLALGAILTIALLLFNNQLYRVTPPTPAYTPSDAEDEITDHGALVVLPSFIADTHQPILSASTSTGTYFRIDFAGRRAINPSIIPHPERDNVWIVTAQLHEERPPDQPRVWFAELVCNAAFLNSSSGGGGRRTRTHTLKCIDPPLILPIAATPSDSTKCTGEQAYFALSIGPHDARTFYGPDGPYTIYGSTSQFTCFGQWLLDFRLLVDWGMGTIDAHGGSFRQPTELQRPPPYRAVEKNWFLFWDAENKPYVHQDIAPARTFATLESDGSVGADLAPIAAVTDGPCLQRLLPALTDPAEESIHQATNALSITLCARRDPACVPDDSNTFILTIVQYKTFRNFRSSYEPYALLFRRVAPFDIYGLSAKPLWIAGRKHYTALAPDEGFARSNEMLYVTSISWKALGQGYHGFSDDVLFISFGVEDADTAAIDVVAGELVAGLGLCASGP